MALFKVTGNSAKIKKALNACKNFNPVILDQTNKSAVIQITALESAQYLVHNTLILGSGTISTPFSDT